MGNALECEVVLDVGVLPHLEELGPELQVRRRIEEGGLGPHRGIAGRRRCARAAVKGGRDPQETDASRRNEVSLAAALREHESREQERVDARLGGGRLDQRARRRFDGDQSRLLLAVPGAGAQVIDADAEPNGVDRRWAVGLGRPPVHIAELVRRSRLGGGAPGDPGMLGSPRGRRVGDKRRREHGPCGNP